MNYEEMLEGAKSSDHHERIISELEQPLKDALANTPSSAAVLEIGNREGGSAVVELYYIALEGKARKFVTVDAGDPNPQLIKDWVTRTSTSHEYHKSSQEDFVKGNTADYGFIFLDSDHDEARVTRDMRVLAPYLHLGGMLAVDDTHEWKEIPDLEDVGLKRVYYEVDMGGRNDHICYWRKM
jgi:cephalosporin hydroxylase